MTRQAPQWMRPVLHVIARELEAANLGLDTELAQLKQWLGLTPTEDPDGDELARNQDIVRRRSRGRCEMRTPACTGTAHHIHHLAGRGWPGCHAPRLLMHCCHPCHTYAHNNPYQAYINGWMVHRHATGTGPTVSKIVPRPHP